MKHLLTVMAIVLISFISNVIFYKYISAPNTVDVSDKHTRLHILNKKGDRVVVFKDGKYYTYYGSITDETSDFVTMKTTLILEGIK